mmetsp:Transcript_21823/g.70464  ORF Transcript_21823/g.70464 Transcript_21823/m.70464 type:complete len:232 (+) Transcript_21823:65-760(+)
MEFWGCRMGGSRTPTAFGGGPPPRARLLPPPSVERERCPEPPPLEPRCAAEALADRVAGEPAPPPPRSRGRPDLLELRFPPRPRASAPLPLPLLLLPPPLALPPPPFARADEPRLPPRAAEEDEAEEEVAPPPFPFPPRRDPLARSVALCSCRSATAADLSGGSGGGPYTHEYARSYACSRKWKQRPEMPSWRRMPTSCGSSRRRRPSSMSVVPLSARSTRSRQRFCRRHT